MKRKQRKLKFKFSVSDEDLKANLKLSPEEIMIWLSRANRFVWQTTTAKQREASSRYLRGV